MKYDQLLGILLKLPLMPVYRLGLKMIAYSTMCHIVEAGEQ